MTGIFAVLKNISILADDTMLAAKNTSAILADDLAVNAQKASGFSPKRELPVLWAITKGSILNKIIVVPIIMLLNYFLPQIIIPLLIIGGIYLAYEGFHNLKDILISLLKKEKEDISEYINKNEDILTIEKNKIKSAIITDFVLSIEIVVIALNSVLSHNFLEQSIIVSLVALLATVGVYGLVGLIIRLDDIGLWFKTKEFNSIGDFCISSMSVIIKSLGYIGTLAMLLVSGEIFIHNIPTLHHIQESITIIPMFITAMIISLFIGTIAYYSYKGIKNIKTKFL
jgi:uncharacterized protein